MKLIRPSRHSSHIAMLLLAMRSSNRAYPFRRYIRGFSNLESLLVEKALGLL